MARQKALAWQSCGNCWKVVGTVREGKGTQLHALADQFPEMLEIEQVDITDADQIEALKGGFCLWDYLLTSNCKCLYKPESCRLDINI